MRTPISSQILLLSCVVAVPLLASAAKGEAVPISKDVSPKALAGKIEEITIPLLELHRTSLSEAVYALKRQARAQADQFILNVVTNPPKGVSLERVTISTKAESVSLHDALASVAKQAGLELHIEDHAVVFGALPPPLPDPANTLEAAIGHKLDSLIISSLIFDEATPGEVAMLLARRARSADLTERNEALRGVNLVVRDDHPEFIGVSMHLDKVPLGTALRYFAAQARLEIRIDDHAVVLGNKLPAKPSTPVESAPELAIWRKMKSIVLPGFNCYSPIRNVAETWQEASLALDEEEVDPAKRGIKIALKGGDEAWKRVDVLLRLNDMPLYDAIYYLALVSECEIRLTDSGVELSQRQKADSTAR